LLLTTNNVFGSALGGTLDLRSAGFAFGFAVVAEF
jgi:hypothetical protein